MFSLTDRQMRSLFFIIELVHKTLPWKNADQFLTALHQLVPYDQSAAFLKLELPTYRFAPSPLTITNLTNFDPFIDHNEYFWKFKRPLLDKLAQQQLFSGDILAMLSTHLSKPKLSEYVTDFWEKHKIRSSYVCYTKTSDGYLATYLTRSPGSRPFTETECHLMDMMFAHLRGTLNQFNLRHAVLLVNARGKIVAKNEEARTAFDQNCSLAVKIKSNLPYWIGEVHLSPLLPKTQLIEEDRFLVSQEGYGPSPLFRVSWELDKESTLPVNPIMESFARQYALSPRQKEVLILVSSGLQMKEMARHLALRIDTVKEYLGGIYRKVGVDGRSALMARLFENTCILKRNDLEIENPLNRPDGGEDDDRSGPH
jgi:DNA-binding CsgD family transcriptional regulator